VGVGERDTPATPTTINAATATSTALEAHLLLLLSFGAEPMGRHG
jgi:hypothetical protein